MNAEAARRLAASILRERRFHAASVPRPLHSLLHDIGTVLQAPGRALNSLVSLIAVALPGGQVTGWILVTVVVAGLIALVVRRYSRGALAGASIAGRAAARAELRAADLEHAADQAEREGRFAEAVRLRFQAGLERLSEQGTITRARSTPTAEVAGSLDSEQFDLLARRFDEIAYGSAAAAAGDAEQSRRAWREVVRGARPG